MHFTNYFTYIFIVYICVKQNLFFKKKTELYFYFIDLVWDGIPRYIIKGSVFLVLFL